MALIQQKSEGISVFLAAVSRAFSRGDLERVADGFLFPTTLYVGSGLIYLESAAAMCREFRIYRDNLVAKGFDRAEVQIKGRQILGEQRVKLTLDWTNHGSGRSNCWRCRKKVRLCWPRACRSSDRGAAGPQVFWPIFGSVPALIRLILAR